MYTNDIPTVRGILVTIFSMFRASTRRRITRNVQAIPLLCCRDVDAVTQRVL